MCSCTIPQPIEAGYSTGMSQPFDSTIFAPIWRWAVFKAVLRMAGASTEDKINLNQRAVAGLPGDGEQHFGLITVTRRFSAGQTADRTHHGGHRGGQGKLHRVLRSSHFST